MNDSWKPVFYFLVGYYIISFLFYISIIFSINNSIREMEIVIESRNYDLVIAKQESGYFELTFNSLILGDVEAVINRNLFNKK